MEAWEEGNSRNSDGLPRIHSCSTQIHGKHLWVIAELSIFVELLKPPRNIHHASNSISDYSGTTSILIRVRYTRRSPPLSPSATSPIRISLFLHLRPRTILSGTRQQTRQRLHPQTFLCPSPIHVSSSAGPVIDIGSAGSESWSAREIGRHLKEGGWLIRARAGCQVGLRSS